MQLGLRPGHRAIGHGHPLQQPHRWARCLTLMLLGLTVSSTISLLFVSHWGLNIFKSSLAKAVLLGHCSGCVWVSVCIFVYTASQVTCKCINSRKAQELSTSTLLCPPSWPSRCVHHDLPFVYFLRSAKHWYYF